MNTQNQPTRGLRLSRAVLEKWAGRPLSDDDLRMLAKAMRNSGVPDAIQTILIEMDQGPLAFYAASGDRLGTHDGPLDEALGFARANGLAVLKGGQLIADYRKKRSR